LKITIKAKLFVGFAVLLILMTLVAMMSTNRLSDLNDRLKHIVDVSAKKIMLGERIKRQVIEINRAKNNVLLSGSQEELSRYVGRIDDLTNEFNIHMKELYSLSLAGNGGGSGLDEFTVWWEKYLVICRQVVDLSRLGNVMEARTLSVEKGRKLLAKAETIMTAFVDKSDQDLNVDKLESDKNYAEARNQSIFVLAIAVIAGILVAVAISRGIVGRVNRMSAKASDIASGKSYKEDEEEGRDELSQVSLSLKEISRSFENITKQAQEIAKGNFSASIDLRSEEDRLGIALQLMSESLREYKTEIEKQDWLKSGQNELNEKMRGDQSVGDLARSIITYLAKYLDAQIGALYTAEEDSDELQLSGAYAFDKARGINPLIKIGEGLAGQAAFGKEVISVTDIPADYVRVNSAIGDSLPRNVLLTPLHLEGELKGVIEIGSFREFSDIHIEFLNLIMENIAIGINSSQARTKLKALLEQTQLQAAELEAQQEELRQINEELQQQTTELKASEEMLKEQQEELEVTNEALEEKTDRLEKQTAEITEINLGLENARRDIERKARQLEIRSKYKSEFLANMSHELRTPLNSLLILAQYLAANKYENLNDDQIESARIIYNSGSELLELINEILDLSKIESGKMPLNVTAIRLSEMINDINNQFKHVTDEKGLTLKISLDEGLPAEITTDGKRLAQIVKNLVSNAIKFTERGGVTVHIHRPGPAVNLSRNGLDPANAITISVIDTGIGIPRDKQLPIFEAFQQVDGSTSRQYGGTGLGLSISRELAKLLGGEIQLESEPGKGSTFSLYIPVEIHEARGGGADAISPDAVAAPRVSHLKTKVPHVKSIPDDREKLEEGDRTILIIEDDEAFAKILMKQCHKRAFKCLVSATGEDGLELAREYLPKALILDIHLPGMNGWHVLDALKNDTNTRHIPVHMISVDEVTIDAFRKGAIGYFTKPVREEHMDGLFKTIEQVIEKRIKDLLVVEDDEDQQKAIAKVIGNSDVAVTIARNGKAAIDALRSGNVDCMVLDLGLPDMSGFELLSELHKDRDMTIPPVIVYTGKELTREEEEELRQYAESIIVKGVKSTERLLDETALFLHRVVDNLSETKQKIITDLHNKDDMFVDKQVLLVDDDMRNVFALSKILREKGMNVLKAENGKVALELLEKESGIDIILMDIMMPVMDGYEAIKEIRSRHKYSNIPIIAETAKAMREDRDKVMKAGANDYLEKPLNIERLLSMMRVWLYQ
jgi:signal transduction histidine kinase/DNA-binding response OmpR family regulator